VVPEQVTSHANVRHPETLSYAPVGHRSRKWSWAASVGWAAFIVHSIVLLVSLVGAVQPSPTSPNKTTLVDSRPWVTAAFQIESIRLPIVMVLSAAFFGILGTSPWLLPRKGGRQCVNLYLLVASLAALLEFAIQFVLVRGSPLTFKSAVGVTQVWYSSVFDCLLDTGVLILPALVIFALLVTKRVRRALR